MKKLENKIAIVTGGAMGNGKGIAKVFLKYGASVIIFDYQEEIKKQRMVCLHWNCRILCLYW